MTGTDHEPAVDDEPHGEAATLLALGSDCAARLPDHIRTVDHGEALYGEDGLPA